MLQAAVEGRADALSMASMLHYDFIENCPDQRRGFLRRGQHHLSQERADHVPGRTRLHPGHQGTPGRGRRGLPQTRGGLLGLGTRERTQMTSGQIGKRAQMAVIDYGMGNLFSIKHACEAVCIQATVTADPAKLMAADVAILPGVGAFGDAMEILNKLDLVSPIRDFADAGKPLVGICLGQQLLMSESCEFGSHRGLDIFRERWSTSGPPRRETGSSRSPTWAGTVSTPTRSRLCGARSPKEGSAPRPGPEHPGKGAPGGLHVFCPLLSRGPGGSFHRLEPHGLRRPRLLLQPGQGQRHGLPASPGAQWKPRTKHLPGHRQLA